jgi:hypothetical protein
MNLLVNTNFLGNDDPTQEPRQELEDFRMAARLAQRRFASDAEVPLLIKALGIHRRGVDGLARWTLQHLAGRDLGGDSGPWLAWWGKHAIPGGGTVPCEDPLCVVGS